MKGKTEMVPTCQRVSNRKRGILLYSRMRGKRGRGGGRVLVGYGRLLFEHLKEPSSGQGVLYFPFEFSFT